MDAEKWGERKNKFGWALVSFIIAALLSPMIAPFVTSVYVGVGAPGFASPELETSVERVDTIYSPGTQVERFDNLTWQEDYGMYRVSFDHRGGPIVERAVFEVRYPGCVRDVAPERPNPGSSPITVHAPVDPVIETTGEPQGEVYGCTQQIITESIHRNEGYSFLVVIDHEPERCDMLVSYNPDERYLVEFSWNERGELIEDRFFRQVEGADNAYADTALPSGSTLIWEENQYQVYIVGEGNGNATQAEQVCYGEQIQ